MSPSFLLLLLILALVTGCIEVDLSVPGFPDIAKDFHVSQNEIQLTLAYNFLGFCLAALFYGPASDKWGRRLVMIMGNGIMMLGAIGCVLAAHLEGLLIARFIQGIGASASAVVVFAIAADVYKNGQLLKVLIFMNSILTISMVLAPIIGGILNVAIGWRGSYGVVALLSTISWLLLVFFLPETKEEISSGNEKRKGYSELLYHGSFMAHALLPSFFYIGYIIFLSCSSFLYINAFGTTVIEYAFHQAVIIGAFTAMNYFAAPLIQTLGKKRSLVISLGICLVAVSGGVVSALAGKASAPIATFWMMVYSCGFSIGYPSVFAESLDFFPHNKGAALSLIMCLRNGLCAGFVALASFYYDGEMQSVFMVLFLCMSVAFLNGIVIFRQS